MARDYKNTRRKPTKKPVPGWVWLLTGLLIGLMVALLVYLAQQPGISGSQKEVQKTQKNKPVIKKKVKQVNKQASKKGLHYEFYTVLPKSEIVISDEEIKQREKAGRPKYRYLLQAGSFRRQQDAESLKARLAFLSIESSIENVTVNGDSWHRIRIGPFKSFREINGTRNRLLKNNINAILIRIK